MTPKMKVGFKSAIDYISPFAKIREQYCKEWLQRTLEIEMDGKDRVCHPPISCVFHEGRYFDVLICNEYRCCRLCARR